MFTLNLPTPTPATLTVTEAAKLLNVGPATAYTAIRRGTFPSEVLKINGRVVIPTAPLLAKLGLSELPATPAA